MQIKQPEFDKVSDKDNYKKWIKLKYIVYPSINWSNKIDFDY